MLRQRAAGSAPRRRRHLAIHLPRLQAKKAQITVTSPEPDHSPSDTRESIALWPAGCRPPARLQTCVRKRRPIDLPHNFNGGVTITHTSSAPLPLIRKPTAPAHPPARPPARLPVARRMITTATHIRLKAYHTMLSLQSSSARTALSHVRQRSTGPIVAAAAMLQERYNDGRQVSPLRPAAAHLLVACSSCAS